MANHQLHRQQPHRNGRHGSPDSVIPQSPVRHPQRNHCHDHVIGKGNQTRNQRKRGKLQTDPFSSIPSLCSHFIPLFPKNVCSFFDIIAHMFDYYKLQNGFLPLKKKEMETEKRPLAAFWKNFPFWDFSQTSGWFPAPASHRLRFLPGSLFLPGGLPAPRQALRLPSSGHFRP